MKALFANVDVGIIGLILFVAMFAMVAIYALRPSSKEKLESYRFIPLSEGDE